jgi:hypothetical protein
MSKIANRLPDQQHNAVQVCPETRMLHGNQLDAVTGGHGCLPAVHTVCEPVRLTDGTSNTICFSE